MSDFSTEQRRIDDSICEISVRGELDLAVADQIDAAIAEVDESWAGLIIGLGDCEFLDSTGIAVIIRAQQRFEASGRRLVICCAEDQVERVLEITGLNEQSGFVYANIEDAVDAIKASLER